MRFNSRSVVMRGGISYCYFILKPLVFWKYNFREGILEGAVEEFNKRLDGRLNVTLEIDNIEVDILRVEVGAGGELYLRVIIREGDIKDLKKKEFTITGDVYLEDGSGEDIFFMVIDNLLYGGKKILL